MVKFVDIPIGTRFGKLVVVKKIGLPGKGAHWLCRCDCGKTKTMYGGHLRCGEIKSCGCSRFIKDITGMIFGKLIVINLVGVEHGNARWNCKCDCGNNISVLACNLKKKNTRSCGCASRDMVEETCLKKYGTRNSFQNTEVRKKFRKNNLKKYGVEYPAQDPKIALKTARSSKNSYILRHWKTGEEIICQAGWEKKVVEYFNENKINFKWQKKTFKVEVDGKIKTYRPDFYLFSIKKWVEIKGYKRELGMKKWNYFHNHIKPNSEMWDYKILKEKGIL